MGKHIIETLFEVCLWHGNKIVKIKIMDNDWTLLWGHSNN